MSRSSPKNPASTLKDDAEIKQFIQNFDHHSKFFRERHKDILAYLLAYAPIIRTEAHGGFWVFSRYDDIVRIAMDDKTFSSEDGITIPGPRGGAKTLPIDVDPPKSNFYRMPLVQLLSKSAMADIKPQLRELAGKLVADKVPAREMDVVLDLAQPLAGIITLRLLGVDETKWHEYAGPIHAATFQNGTEAEMIQGMMKYYGQVGSDIKDPKICAAGGVVQKLREYTARGRSLTEEELFSMVNLFYIGGLDTAQAGVGTITNYLAKDTSLRARLAGNPSLVPGAVEELLRVFAPQQCLARTATADTEVGGVKIRKGEKVMMLWAAGNFDESKFECPFEVNIDRPADRHLTFGIGAHTCAGLHLARAEIQAAIEALLAHVPEYSIVEDGTKFANDVGVVFGYDRLRIAF
jgi:cytochrome P450